MNLAPNWRELHHALLRDHHTSIRKLISPMMRAPRRRPLQAVDGGVEAESGTGWVATFQKAITVAYEAEQAVKRYCIAVNTASPISASRWTKGALRL